MNEVEKVELKSRLKTWLTACCGRNGKSRNSICTVGQRVNCEAAFIELVALVDRQPDDTLVGSTARR